MLAEVPLVTAGDRSATAGVHLGVGAVAPLPLPLPLPPAFLKAQPLSRRLATSSASG